MRKVLFEDFKIVFYALLLSIFVEFVFLPRLLNMSLISRLISSENKTLLLGVTAGTIILLLYSWESANDLWRRYRNTYSLEKFKLILPDHLVFFFIFCAVLNGLGNISLNMSSTFRAYIEVNCIIVLVWIISSYLYQRKIGQTQSASFDPLSDEPIDSDDKDLLGRVKFVDGLFNEIENFPSKDSFLFGLYGNWGDGKTSALRMLKRRIISSQAYLLVDFDPWYFTDDETILSAFYNQVEQSIQQDFLFPSLKSIIARYQRYISFGFRNSGLDVSFLRDVESLEETKRRIA